jgi:hypothetical protein
MLLKQRRDIGVDDDVAHWSQASEALRLARRPARNASSTASDPQMSAASSPGSATGSACPARARSGPVRHRLGFLGIGCFAPASHVSEGTARNLAFSREAGGPLPEGI